MENCKAIGIDLGTTYSCVAVFRNGRAEVLSNNFQKRMTPSCVAYTVNGIRVGEAAKKYLSTDPSNTICAVKRIMGRQFNDQSVQNYIQHWPYKVIASNDNKPLIEVQLKRETKNIRSEDVSAEILRYMKQTAEKHLGHDVTDAVITVPANFTDAQRQATFNAARLAGLNVLRLMNEPTAAAVAYGYENIPSTQSNHNLLIFDLGGGTLDVSIVTIDKQHSFKVLATAGNSNLGGDDFDQRIRERFTKEFRRMSQSDVSANTRAMANLLQICERAKCEVSENEVDSVNIADLHDRKDFQYEFTRIDFEALCDDLFQEAMLIVEAAGKKTVLKPRQIHEIVLVGGSSRIPKIQAMMQKKFRGRPISTSINPDEAIACGAAIVAAQVSGFHMSIRNNSLQVTDILGWSICIKDYWGKLIDTIPRGTAIPIRYQQIWCTAYDNCTAIGFAVYQQKKHQGDQNRDEIEYLGRFDISGFPSKPKEEVKLIVYMDVDASGVLHVTAIEQATGIQNQVTFTRRVVD